MSEPGAAGNRLVSIGSSPPHEFSLDKPTIAIGSHPKNDVVVDDTTVSRRHATITRKAGGFELADLGSTNGTFVNGVRVNRPVALKPGDEIKFGSVRFAFGPMAVPRRLGRGIAILTAMFIAGFAVARYRGEIGPAVTAIVAKISSREASFVPAASNTQSASSDAAATAGVTSAPAPNPAAGQPEWLMRVNYYRAMVKLPPIVEDPELSKGDRAHTMYIVMNYHDAI